MVHSFMSYVNINACSTVPQPGALPRAPMKHNVPGFKILAAITKKTAIFWNVTPSSVVQVQMFRSNVLHPSSARKVSQTTNQNEVTS
jgi:hypothetical protein